MQKFDFSAAIAQAKAAITGRHLERSANCLLRRRGFRPDGRPLCERGKSVRLVYHHNGKSAVVR